MNRKWQSLAESLLDAAGKRHQRSMLERASELFGRHGCNDFDFPKDWTNLERCDFVRMYHEWNGDPEEFNPRDPTLPDFAVMAFLASLSRER